MAMPKNLYELFDAYEHVREEKRRRLSEVCDFLDEDYELRSGAVSVIKERWREKDIKFVPSRVYEDAAHFTGLWLLLHGERERALRLPYWDSVRFAERLLVRSGISTMQELIERSENGTKRVPEIAPASNPLNTSRLPDIGAAEKGSLEERYLRLVKENAALVAQRNRLVTERDESRMQYKNLQTLLMRLCERIDRWSTLGTVSEAPRQSDTLFDAPSSVESVELVVMRGDQGTKIRFVFGPEAAETIRQLEDSGRSVMTRMKSAFADAHGGIPEDTVTIPVKGMPAVTETFITSVGKVHYHWQRSIYVRKIVVQK